MKIDNDKRKLIAAIKAADEACFMVKGSFKHHLFGDYIAANHPLCLINNTLHVFDGRRYRPAFDILDQIMTAYYPGITDRQRKETTKYLTVSPKTQEREVSPPYYIPLLSEVLDIRTMQRIPYGNPDFVFLQTFPVDYPMFKPEIPIVEKYRRDVADGDKEIIDFLDEFRGYCLYRENIFRAAVLLFGPRGNNGKSTELNLATQFVGEANTSHLSLQDTAERFRLIGLYGKALNAGDDIPATYLPESSTFKKLVTGEPVVAERKGEQPIEFQNTAKLLFAANELPPVSDKSEAFYSRVIVLPFLHDFGNDADADPEIKGRRWSQDELNAFCYYAINGLQRLLRNKGKFTMPKKAQTALEEYREQNDPVVSFIAETGINGIVGKSSQAVYEEFRTFCAANGHRNVLTAKRFTSAVKNHLAADGITTKPKKYGGKTLQCFVVDEEIQGAFRPIDDSEELPFD